MKAWAFGREILNLLGNLDLLQSKCKKTFYLSITNVTLYSDLNYQYGNYGTVKLALFFALSMRLPLWLSLIVLVPSVLSSVSQKAIAEPISIEPVLIGKNQTGNGKIAVKQFDFKGSTVFSQAELAAVTKPYLNKSLSIIELHEIRNRISKLYEEKGYVNSGAYIPEQKFEGGKIEIAILEGGLEGIRIGGNKHLRNSYIKSRLDADEELVNVNDLLTSLQLLRLDPKIESVSAQLSPGLSPGKSYLDIKVKETDSFYLTTQLDNNRSPSVGSFQRSIGINHNSLLGFGDRANLNYHNTEGSNAIDLSYAVPLNSKNGTLAFDYGWSDNDVIEEAFNALDIQSKSQLYKLGFNQPILLKPEREFSLGLDFTHQRAETSLLGENFPLSRGADESGNTNISALRFNQNYINRSDEEVLAFRSQFSLGLDAFDATINEGDVPDSTFFSWRGQSQWVKSLSPDTLFLLRGDVQLAGGSLVPLEQFRAGGAQSVRGYRQDLSLGDNGLFASAEMRLPIMRFDSFNGVVQLTPFADFATLWNSGEFEIANSTLPSIGVGLNFKVADRFNARLDWGIPLSDVDGGDSLQESGVYFSLFSNLF